MTDEEYMALSLKEQLALDNLEQGKRIAAEAESKRLEREVAKERKRLERIKRGSITLKQVENLFDDIWLDPDAPQYIKNKMPHYLATAQIGNDLDTEKLKGEFKADQVAAAHDANRKKGKTTKQIIIEEYLQIKDAWTSKRKFEDKKNAADKISVKHGIPVKTVQNIITDFKNNPILSK